MEDEKKLENYTEQIRKVTLRLVYIKKSTAPAKKYFKVKVMYRR